MKATDDHEDDFVLIRLSDAEPILDGMGIYFIADPDGYWLEVVPERK